MSFLGGSCTSIIFSYMPHSYFFHLRYFLLFLLTWWRQRWHCMGWWRELNTCILENKKFFNHKTPTIKNYKNSYYLFFKKPLSLKIEKFQWCNGCFYKWYLIFYFLSILTHLISNRKVILHIRKHFFIRQLQRDFFFINLKKLFHASNKTVKTKIWAIFYL